MLTLRGWLGIVSSCSTELALLPAALAEVADPLAEVRAQSLESARAAAQVALERRKAKKAKQNARQGLSGDTPPAKKQGSIEC